MRQPDILVRPSQSSDIPAITRTYAHAVIHGTASWELAAPDDEEMARRRLAIIESGLPYLVAELNGTPAGYAYAAAYRPRAAYRATVEDSLYVHPDAQGQGVGRALLSALLKVCEAKGHRQMIAVIGDGYGASAASLRLHESLGFEVIGIARSVGFKRGRWLDQVLMQKSLGQGDLTPSSFV